MPPAHQALARLSAGPATLPLGQLLGFFQITPQLCTQEPDPLFCLQRSFIFQLWNLRPRVNHGTRQPSPPKASGRAGAALQAAMGRTGSASLGQLVGAAAPRARRSCLRAFLRLPSSFATRHPVITHTGLRSPAQRPSLSLCHQLIPEDNSRVAAPSSPRPWPEHCSQQRRRMGYCPH